MDNAGAATDRRRPDPPKRSSRSKAFTDLEEREILALAIALEEEDSRKRDRSNVNAGQISRL
jgi:hypothetical protein